MSIDVSALWAKLRQLYPEIYGINDDSVFSKIDIALHGPDKIDEPGPSNVESKTLDDAHTNTPEDASTARRHRPRLPGLDAPRRDKPVPVCRRTVSVAPSTRLE